MTSEGKLLTRAPTHEILNGITRRTIISLAKKAGVEFEERAFTLDEAKVADEAFFTSATSLITPATSIDGEKIGNGKVGPVTAMLQKEYLQFSRAPQTAK